ncbi:tyrosine-type recombinase/integrase [Cytobacillus oceanisediminis]|nr:tyrosine-type recombinase/integrase [Cytobacillus oceanisediminis]
MKSEEYIEKFKDEYSFRLAKKTLDVYKTALEQLFNHCEKPFKEITVKDIRNWLVFLDSNGYRPTAVKTKLAGLKLFYKYCLEEEIITHNPLASIGFPKVEETLPRYLQIDQLTQLRKIVEGKLWERAIIETLYATGIRLSELAAMKKDDIDWSERIIHIPQGKGKKARIVLFTNACAAHLNAYIQNRQDDLPFVFVNPFGRKKVGTRTINTRFETYSKLLGFPLTPHTLRHTFAAHLAIKGMPLECIQVLLGHDSPHQTQIYARLYNYARKQKYDEWM